MTGVGHSKLLEIRGNDISTPTIAIAVCSNHDTAQSDLTTFIDQLHICAQTYVATVVAIDVVTACVTCTICTVRNDSKEIVMQPTVIGSPHLATVVHVHVPVAIGFQKPHQPLVVMKRTRAPVRIDHVDVVRSGGDLQTRNGQGSRHRVARLRNPT